MIVIYTQDETLIKNSAAASKKDLVRLYGEKLGAEAYTAIKDNRLGTVYRKNGGPLVKVVNSEDAESIREKEIRYGMI